MTSRGAVSLIATPMWIIFYIFLLCFFFFSSFWRYWNALAVPALNRHVSFFVLSIFFSSLFGYFYFFFLFVFYMTSWRLLWRETWGYTSAFSSMRMRTLCGIVHVLFYCILCIYIHALLDIIVLTRLLENFYVMKIIKWRNFIFFFNKLRVRNYIIIIRI